MSPREGQNQRFRNLFKHDESGAIAALETLQVDKKPGSFDTGNALASLGPQVAQQCLTVSKEEWTTALYKRNPNFCYKCKDTVLNETQLTRDYIDNFLEINGDKYTIRPVLLAGRPVLLDKLFHCLEDSLEVNSGSTRKHARLCTIHSLPEESFHLEQWKAVWTEMTSFTQDQVLKIETGVLSTYLERHLRRFALCTDCSEVVRTAFDGVVNGFAEGQEFSDLYVKPFEICNAEENSGSRMGSTGEEEGIEAKKWVKVSPKYACMLVQKALEAEDKFNMARTINADTHRHATSIVQGQREFLYCVGAMIRSRTQNAWHELLLAWKASELLLWTIVNCARKKLSNAYRRATSGHLSCAELSKMLAPGEYDSKRQHVKSCKAARKAKNCKKCKAKRSEATQESEPVKEEFSCAGFVEDDPVLSVRLRRYLHSRERQELRAKLRSDFNLYCQKHAHLCDCHLIPKST